MELLDTSAFCPIIAEWALVNNSGLIIDKRTMAVIDMQHFANGRYKDVGKDVLNANIAIPSHANIKPKGKVIISSARLENGYKLYPMVAL